MDITSYERHYELTELGDTARKIYIAGRDGEERIRTIFNNDAVLALNQQERKEDGFNLTRNIRRVAHIDMNTVKLLAQTDHDADAYYQAHDTNARDRMIRRYPHLFKACSGGV